MPDRQPLTELQIAILRLLWENGELTAAQIWEQLYAERKLAQTTVATIVARLQRRRILARRTRDKQFVYRPLVTEADVQHSMVSELTERLFAGDVTALVSHLVSARDMTPGDLARVKKILQAARPKTGESA
ncbi:MAG TPA: BlaI/MecI/CopY family transcriptional regulator [Gemmatimonadaceae bacterium]|nr:BlaI/MecI/CopY family transcriptional regulator [Gemmatimonadaceae bacterium]